METLLIPDTVPVMTLPNTVFFPQSLLPLHIFEPRYRRMLLDVLATDRLFAVARLDASAPATKSVPEPLHRIASIGIIRACQKADNDTSNLLIQGLCRVEILEIVREHPYRLIAVKTLASTPGAKPPELADLRTEVMRLVNLRRRLGAPAPQGVTQFLATIDDTDAFADLAAFNLCDDGEFKQTLLETLDTGRRLQLFATRLKTEIESIRLRRKLQGRLPEDDIANN